MPFYKFLSSFFLFTISLSVFSQGVPVDVSQGVATWIANYRVEGYRPTKPMGYEDIRVDDSLRTVCVVLNESFCAQPLTPERVTEVTRQLQLRLPPPYNTYSVSLVDTKGQSIEAYIPNHLRTSGRDESRLWGQRKHEGAAWVTNTSRPLRPENGLEGRHLMVTPSHGRYYKQGKWEWQRPFLYCTTEDLFTQSIVVPFLYPMLENAGAVVGTARERDYQTAMVVVDNDAPAQNGTYEETGDTTCQWRNAAVSGYAHPGATLTDGTNPFSKGTARIATATTRRNHAGEAVWTPVVPRTGKYAVYVSYASLPNSIDDAQYTVYHAGGKTTFRVNQQMGGGTWVYLGTFLFEKGQSRQGRVVLSTQTSGRGVVSADAVRLGGGMSLVSRGSAGRSGLPRFLEGARYHALYSGMPRSVYNSMGDGTNDYNDDIRTRSDMCNFMAGRSAYLPAEKGLGVPFELCLAIHSDAGVRRDGGVYGTLGICTTTVSDSIRTFPGGLSRQSSADLANLLLNTVSEDLSRALPKGWTRREMWDRNYGESRMPLLPSAILETMSHQNFGDLIYGHDPWFKFLMARAIYKGILRFVNYEHGIRDFVVQPLPVHGMSAVLSGDGKSVTLSWQATPDTLERSAQPTGYLLYIAHGDGGFDNGQLITGRTTATVGIQHGEVLRFRIAACNSGGQSLLSEEVAVFSPEQIAQRVLIVNAFDRVSGPAQVVGEGRQGFDLDSDIGVAWGYNASYCGRQKNFSTSLDWTEGSNALGYSGSEYQGKIFAGNTFDFVTEHAQAIATNGNFAISSCSREAFERGHVDVSAYDLIDIVGGLQRDAPQNLRPHALFTPIMRQRLTECAQRGTALFVSGAYLGSELRTPEAREFGARVLHYTHADTLTAGGSELVTGLGKQIPIHRTPGEQHYAAQHPEVIMPADANTFSAFAYEGGHGAGTAYGGAGARVVCMAFPFECIKERETQRTVMRAILRFLLPNK